MLDNYGDILTSHEVLEILYIGKDLLYKLIREDTLPAYKVGKLLRFKKSDVIELFENNTPMQAV